MHFFIYSSSAAFFIPLYVERLVLFKTAPLTDVLVGLAYIHFFCVKSSSRPTFLSITESGGTIQQAPLGVRH